MKGSSQKLSSASNTGKQLANAQNSYMPQNGHYGAQARSFFTDGPVCDSCGEAITNGICWTSAGPAHSSCIEFGG